MLNVCSCVCVCVCEGRSVSTDRPSRLRGPNRLPCLMTKTGMKRRACALAVKTINFVCRKRARKRYDCGARTPRLRDKGTEIERERESEIKSKAKRREKRRKRALSRLPLSSDSGTGGGGGGSSGRRRLRGAAR